MNKVVNSIEAKDLANHFHPYTNPQILKNGPHVMCRGEGIYVYDNTGAKFIEGMVDYGVHHLGSIIKNLLRCDQANGKASFYHSFRKSTRGGANLSEKLLKIAPDGLDKVFFVILGQRPMILRLKLFGTTKTH